MDPVAFARELSAANPASRLPCPVCATSVKGENLARHLEKVHAGVASTTASTWRGKGVFGWFPCSVALEGATFTLRHWLGLARRAVTIPCAIEVGATFGSRPDAITASYADDHNLPGETVRTGRYLRLVGDRTITIGCRHTTQFALHWDRAGWKDGGRRRSCDLVVPREAMVAIEYALAQHGLLRPTTLIPLSAAD